MLAPPAQADTFGQTPQLLEGKNIYISLANDEISLFDRSESGASRFAALLVRAGANIEVLNWELPVPQEADVIILLAPGSDYSSAQIANLWNYVNNGGDLLIFADPEAGLSDRSAIIELLWTTFGISVEEGVLLDPDPEVSAPALITDLLLRTPDHPVLESVDTDTLSFNEACALRVEELVFNDIVVTPLLETSSRFYGETDTRAYSRDGVFGLNIGDDLAFGNHLVAAVSENVDTGSRIAVYCDSGIVLNNGGFATSPSGSARFLQLGSVQLSINTIYWFVGADLPTLSFEEPAATATPTITPSPTNTPLPTSTPTPELTPEAN
jgi:hypothetical protein